MGETGEESPDLSRLPPKSPKMTKRTTDARTNSETPTQVRPPSDACQGDKICIACQYYNVPEWDYCEPRAPPACCYLETAADDHANRYCPFSSTGEERQARQELSMFMPSSCEEPAEESVDYEEKGELFCNMAGDTWESLPYPISIDRGAAASVLPEKWFWHVQTMSTQASRSGEHYTAANGCKIFNRGDKIATMMSREGHLRNMKFTSCDVKRAVWSVSAIFNQGHTVVFNAADHPDGSYIYHIESGERWTSSTMMACSCLRRGLLPRRNKLTLFKGRDVRLREAGLERRESCKTTSQH